MTASVLRECGAFGRPSRRASTRWAPISPTTTSERRCSLARRQARVRVQRTREVVRDKSSRSAMRGQQLRRRGRVSRASPGSRPAGGRAGRRADGRRSDRWRCRPGRRGSGGTRDRGFGRGARTRRSRIGLLGADVLQQGRQSPCWRWRRLTHLDRRSSRPSGRHAQRHAGQSGPGGRPVAGSSDRPVASGRTRTRDDGVERRGADACV